MNPENIQQIDQSFDLYNIKQLLMISFFRPKVDVDAD